MGRLRAAGRVLTGWLLVRNADAGSDDADRVAAVAEALPGRAEVRTTRDPDELDGVLRDAADRDGRLLVCGGDGTVSAAVGAGRRLGLLDVLVLGILPLGTGNDLAGALGIPVATDRLVEVLTRGVERRLDLVVIDPPDPSDPASLATSPPTDRPLPQVAVNAVHVGVGLEAARRAEDLKQPLGALAYPLGAVAAAAAHDGLELRVTVDTERVDLGGPVLLAVVANGPTVGGGAPAVPGAEPDDGQLDVMVSHAVGPAERAAFGVAMHRGTHLDRDDVVHVRGADVVLEGASPLGHDADGELVAGGSTTRHYRVEPAAWTVLAPSP